LDEDEASVSDDNGEGSSARVEALALKAESVRAELDRLLAELRRRGQHALDWRRQLAARPLLFALPAAALLGGVVALIVGASVRRRREREPLVRLRRLLGVRG